MEKQTKYILSQVRNTRFTGKVMTVFVEAEIKNSSNGSAVATLSMLWKKRGTWLSAVNNEWRQARSTEVLTTTESLFQTLNSLKQFYPANKHMIITAGHGSVIGINYYLPGLVTKSDHIANSYIDNKIRNEFSRLDEKLPVTNPAGAENSKLLFLSNEEINAVFRRVFPEKKVDVFVMYNCLMQNLYTQFEFRETVDWFVAPVSGITIPGFNYVALLDEINLNPYISSEMIARLFISSFRSGNAYSLYQGDMENTWKVAAMKLDSHWYNNVQEAFFDLVSRMNTCVDVYGRQVINCIKEVMRYIFNYAFHCLDSIHIPDLGVFLEYFKELIENDRRYSDLKELTPAIEHLQKILSERGPGYVFQGNHFYNNGIGHIEDEDRYKKNISDIGILFPFKKFYSKDCIEPIFDKSSYDREGKPRPGNNIPSFFKNVAFASLVTSILSPP